MADQLLLGNETVAGASNWVDDYLIHHQFTCATSGNVTALRYYNPSGTSGNITIALYTDTGADAPSALSVQGSGVVPAAVQWNSITVTSTAVEAGTKYWITIDLDTNNLTGYITDTGNVWFKSWAYGTAFPDPAGASGYTKVANRVGLLSGYGNTGGGGQDMLLLGVG